MGITQFNKWRKSSIFGNVTQMTWRQSNQLSKARCKLAKTNITNFKADIRYTQ